MKFALLLILSLSSAWAKPLVMISYFDAFNGAPFNNSERIARELESRLNHASSPITVKLCELKTIYDVSYAQTEECLKALPESPVMVIGLGETGCDLKVENMMKNYDYNRGPDNAGNSRSAVIVQGAPELLGLRYPLPQMYCALSKAEKKKIVLSSNAGTFVCNNTAYLMTHFHPEIQYGFIHVPRNKCENLAEKTSESIAMLEKMIPKGVSYLLGDKEDSFLPHTNNGNRLPTTKDAFKVLRKAYSKKDACLEDYFKGMVGADWKVSEPWKATR